MPKNPAKSAIATRLAIAEHTRQFEWRFGFDGRCVGLFPKDSSSWKIRGRPAPPRDAVVAFDAAREVPNYSAEMDAIHRAEQALDTTTLVHLQNHLKGQLRGGPILRATAKQHVRAYVAVCGLEPRIREITAAMR